MKTPEKKNKTLDEQLAPFLKQNPYSKVERRKKFHYVVNPWNDKSVSFLLKPNSQSDLIAALNNVILPPRFTALYHLDSNKLECIYTLLDKKDPCISRDFDFTIDGRTYHCRFGDASDRLLLISKFSRRVKEVSRADYRNLMPLRAYMDPKFAEPWEEGFFAEGKPISFFIDGFERFNEDEILEISKHLNFFMLYYDTESPWIFIHPVVSEEVAPVKQLQFIETHFPTKISTCCQDPFLLDLAMAAHMETGRLSFVYYYQVLEYAAFYYVHSDVRKEMLRVIASPDIHANPDRYITKLLDAMGDIRQSDEAKLNKIVEIRCSPEIVWKELQQNLPYFSKRQVFEGGFVVEPFISEDMTLESFSTMWVPKMPDTLRKIRNALVHGRENRLGASISPTEANEIKIRPWVPVIRRIAQQVIIFGGLT